MNNRKKVAAALLMAIVMIAASIVTVSAESNEYKGKCSFDGKKITSNFSSKTVAKAVEDLQPGDEVSFEVTYTNEYAGSTDWYMENEVIKTLEKTSQARKVVAGTGSAENGGYTYELIHYNRNGNKNVLFSNDEVGGEVKPAGMEGLEQATNALDDWFYIDTLKKGESGRVVLHVAFDGETEVNDYMDTDGELNLRFAVELTPKGKTRVKTVYTGDQSNLIMWAAICLVGALLLFVIAFLSRRRDQSKQGKGGKA